MQRITPIQPGGSGLSVFVGLDLREGNIGYDKVVAVFLDPHILVGHDPNVCGLIQVLRNPTGYAVHLDPVHLDGHVVRPNTEEMTNACGGLKGRPTTVPKADDGLPNTSCDFRVGVVSVDRRA